MSNKPFDFFTKDIKEELKPVNNYTKPELDTSLNIFEWIKGKIYITKKESEAKMLDTIKNFLTGFIVRWILKIGGGFLLSVGLDEGSVTKVTSAIVAIIIGLVVSLFQHNEALNTDLKTLQK